MGKRIDEEMLLRTEPILSANKTIDDLEDIKIELNLLDKDKKTLNAKPLERTIPKAEETKNIKNILKKYNSTFDGKYIIKYEITAKQLAKDLGIEEKDEKYKQISYLSFRIDADCSGTLDKTDAEQWFDVEIVKQKTYLYFVLYSSDTQHIQKLQISAQKVFNDIREKIKTKENPKDHIAYLQVVNSESQMINFIQNKIEENGGKTNVIIGKLEAIKEIKQETSLFERIGKALDIKPSQNNLLKTQPYFKDEIDQQTINEYNENIMRNERLHQHLASKEHQKYVMLKVADDLDTLSDSSGALSALVLTGTRFYPASAPIAVPIGGGLAAVSFTATGGKNLFKYFADEFQKEELITDLILAKTIYVKNNELAEFAYDKAFSEMAKYFYE